MLQWLSRLCKAAASCRCGLALSSVPAGPWYKRGAGPGSRAGEAGAPWRCLPGWDRSCETPAGRDVQPQEPPSRSSAVAGDVLPAHAPCPPQRGSAQGAKAASRGSLPTGACHRRERLLRLRRQTHAGQPCDDGIMRMASCAAWPTPAHLFVPSRDLHLNVPMEGTLQQPRVI